MIRKCTRYIFLFFLALIIIPSSIYLVGLKENDNVSSDEYPQKSYNAIGASSDEDVQDADPGFYIKNYKVDIVVGENNILHISEVIDCNFYALKHGIYRDIPLVNKVEREDGTTSSNIAQISNIKVDHNYSKSSSDGSIRLIIGDADKLITGDQTYIISYDYNLGKDRIKKYDELYFNLIGTQWTTHIEKVNFTIEMPKDFNKEALGFSSGYKGSTSSDVIFNVDGRKITGETTAKLLKGQALSVRLQLPENYFVGEGNISDTLLTAGYVVPFVLFAIVLALFIWGNNKNKKIPTVEFYPPEGLTSVDVALIYKGKVRNPDVVSLLVSLADKGYLKIEQYGEDKDSMRITRCKPYSGNDDQEREFMNALFGTESGESVTTTGLRETSFPKDMTQISKNTNSKDFKKKYFDTRFLFVGLISKILAVFALLTSVFIMLAYNPGMLAIYIFPILAFIVIKISMPTEGIFQKVIFCVFMMFWGGIPLVFGLSIVLDFGFVFFVSNILGLVYFATMFIMSGKMGFRTLKGGELYAKILGFRNFLKTAEKAKLEALCNEQPSYFYNILPYAYVLGVSNVWIKKFESIAIENPDWYSSSIDMAFSLAMCNNMFTSVSRASAPKSSGGGSGGSGGGFSGGGSGGGGGGSW